MPYERMVPIVVLGFVLGGCGSEESPPDPATSGCPTYDSAFEAIQKSIFERRGCTATACHGSAAAGELDLRADVAFNNLVNAASAGSGLKRVNPSRVKDSYLFQKLAARSDPGLVTSPIAGAPMPLSGEALTPQELEAVRLWIEAAAPEEGSIGDEFGGNRLAELLSVCLPESSPVAIQPLA